jgi:hypothetical protein
MAGTLRGPEAAHKDDAAISTTVGTAKGSNRRVSIKLVAKDVSCAFKRRNPVCAPEEANFANRN